MPIISCAPLTTTPEKSRPGVRGSVVPSMRPRTFLVSLGFTDAARTSTTTSPGRGRGAASSSTLRLWKLPNSWKRSACMAAAFRGASAADFLAGRGGLGFAFLFGSLAVSPDHRDVHQVFRQEPHLQLVGADDIADQHVVGSVVTRIRGLPRHAACFLQNDLVSFEQ